MLIMVQQIIQTILQPTMYSQLKMEILPKNGRQYNIKIGDWDCRMRINSTWIIFLNYSQRLGKRLGYLNGIVVKDLLSHNPWITNPNVYVSARTTGTTTGFPIICTCIYDRRIIERKEIYKLLTTFRLHYIW
jgi:hypothetical protein